MIFNQINIHLLIVILIINISFSSSRNEESIQDIDSNSLHNRHHKNQLRKRNQHHNELDSNLDRESNKVVNNDHTAPMNENYDWTFPMLDKSIVHNIDNIKNVLLIYEIGSRDCADANKIALHYNSSIVYAFEASPDNWVHMEKNNLNNRVKIVKSAVALTNGFVDYYPFNLTLYNNGGASSMYVIDYTKREKRDKDLNRTPPQYKVSVPSIRMDTFIEKTNNKVPQIIFLDVQEYEMNVLLSFGKYLSLVNYIIVEVAFFSTYIGGVGVEEIHKYITKSGFSFHALKESGRNSILYEMPMQKKRGEADVIYINNKLK